MIILSSGIFCINMIRLIKKNYENITKRKNLYIHLQYGTGRSGSLQRVFALRHSMEMPKSMPCHYTLHTCEFFNLNNNMRTKTLKLRVILSLVLMWMAGGGHLH